MVNISFKEIPTLVFSTLVQVNTPSDLSCVLLSARALSIVICDANSALRILADEVEHVAQGAVHAVLEAPAQTHIEQWVEAAVEVCQAES